MRIESLLASALLLATSPGCRHTAAASAAGLPQFPSSAELERLAAAPATVPPPEPTRRVPSWTLAAPLPTQIGSAPHERASATGALLAESLGPGVLLSAGMHCVAREYGRFWLAHAAMPAPELATFILARCGEPVADLQVAIGHGDTPGAADLSGPWRAGTEATLAKLPRSGVAVGAWSGEQDGRSVVVVVHGERTLELEPLPIDAGRDGIVELRGRFIIPVSGSSAHVTRGAYGFRECLAVPGTAAPRFRFRCAVDPADPTVFLELSTSAPGRLLSERAMIAMISPGQPAPDTHAARDLARPATPMQGRGAPALLAAIAGLRDALGMRPLRHAEAQSVVAGRLLPHYLAASHNHDGRTADLVALGMIAGWQVDGGTLRDGAFLGLELDGAESVDLALEAALMSPARRAALLDPRSAAIALAARDSGDGSQAIVATYQFFETLDLAASEQAILDVLDRERAALGRRPVIRVDGNSAPPLAAARSKIHAGADMNDALQVMLSDIVGKTGLAMRGLALHTTDLDSLQFPKDLLDAEHVQIDLDLSQHRPAGSPWGMFLVLFLYTDA
ncbi:MAG: hypothetical protein IPO88_23460 [Nannocystis sp.]|uniref:hypothetical protein n=1 Tax=Nannocystis sp. TaxID=1962667 RepID=UPI002429905D|nr:hypothetical protein [Nannocystis sp.]MBK9756400.1 hypothetical protein [Nannocystis sp.]